MKTFLSLCIVLLMPALALAQTTTPAPDTTVDFDPFIAEVVPYALTLFGAIVTALLAWATKKLNDWTGITIEAKHREALQSALLNGARTVIAKNVPSGVEIDVKSVPLREGIEFVLESVPDAVKYFGLDAASIEKHLVPKLEAVLGTK